MLLRASSEKAGATAELNGALGDGDGGLPAGAELLRFAEAVTRDHEDAGEAREALIGAVGRDGFIDASCIVGIFNGLVRTADASGIPLDEGTRNASAQFRDALGLNAFGGARNTDLEAPTAPASDDPLSAFR